nr:hypothetical protein [Tanacetum cinerariifolium]
MLDHRSKATDHRSTMADHDGDRRSMVAVNNGHQWGTTVDRCWTSVDHHRTTIDRRWTTINHHRTAGQRWLVGRSGRVWIEFGPGLDRVRIRSGLGRPCGMPRVSRVCLRVSHVCPRGFYMDDDVDNIQHEGVEPGTSSSATQGIPQEPAKLEHTYIIYVQLV